MTSSLLANHATRDALFKAYVRILGRLCEECGIDARYVAVSPLGISAVFNEVQSDLNALRMRRNFSHGISAGKIAGSLAFRLYRTNVLTLAPALAENRAAQKLQLNAAVALAFELVGTNFALWPGSLVREIKYFLAKRHSNQEALGICFDTIECARPA